MKRIREKQIKHEVDQKESITRIKVVGCEDAFARKSSEVLTTESISHPYFTKQ